MSRKPTILVVEDDAGVRDLIRAHLGAAGYDPHIARNGVEAIRRIWELKPDGIILDINMPEMDGFQVLEAMKIEFRGRRFPVLVMTARHDVADVKRAIVLGAKDYMTKPFRETELMARVARLVRPPQTIVSYTTPAPAPVAPPPEPDALLL